MGGKERHLEVCWPLSVAKNSGQDLASAREGENGLGRSPSLTSTHTHTHTTRMFRCECMLSLYPKRVLSWGLGYTVVMPLDRSLEHNMLKGAMEALNSCLTGLRVYPTGKNAWYWRPSQLPGASQVLDLRTSYCHLFNQHDC